MSESQDLDADESGTTAPGCDCGLIPTPSDRVSCSHSAASTVDGAGDRSDARSERDPVVLLIAPRWAAPARPALLIAPELSRRWKGRPRLLVVDDPDHDLLEAIDVEEVPTWLRFEDRTDAELMSAESPEVPDDRPSTAIATLLRNSASNGDPLVIPGNASHLDAEHRSRAERCGDSGKVEDVTTRWVETARLTGAHPKHAVDTLLANPLSR